MRQKDYSNDTYVSLFDYLGSPAGPQLGRKVSLAAKKEEIPYSYRTIESEDFSGKIKLYPTKFLKKYFQK